MDEHGEFVSMSRVLDSSKNGFEGNLGFGEDEIMVEIVGSDVFVDGVGGNVGGSREVRNGGFEGNVQEEVGVEDYGVIEDVVFLECGGGLDERDEVTGSGDMCCGNGGGLDGCKGVLGSGDMSCVLSSPSAHQGSGVRDEGFSCESEASAGDSVVATGLSKGETEVVGEKLTCCFNEDTVEPMVEKTSKIGFLGDDALNPNADSGFTSYSVIAKTEEISEQVFVEVKEKGLNGKDQVVHNIVVDEESPCLETVPSTSVERVYVETDTGTACANAESVDHQTEAVAGVNEIICDKETLHSGPKIIESDVYEGNLQRSAGQGIMKNKMVTKSSGDHVNVSVDSVSSQKPAKLVVDNQVADDDANVSLSKGIETCNGVDLSEGRGDYGEGTQTYPDLVSTTEGTQVVAGYNEVICNAIFTVNDIQMTTNDSFLPNPTSKISVIKAVQCETKFADAGKDWEQVLISGKEVTEMYFEEATKYKGSEADVLGAGLSVCGVNDSSGEATLMRTEVLDLKEAPTSGVDYISGCTEDVRNVKCDPIADESVLPTNEECSQRQALVSETRTVQHMKADESFRNSVAQEHCDMEMLSEGTVEASVETIFDKTIDSNSKTMVLDGDANLVEDKNMNGLDSRGSGTVNKEKKYDMQKPDVKRSGSLGCEIDENKILNQPLADEILNEGDKPVTGSLVANLGTLCNEEEKNIQGSHLDRNVSLSYKLYSADSNVQETERNIDLQLPECLDASSACNHIGFSSDQDHILEVEYDEEQVDVRTDQEMEIQDEAINIRGSEVIDEKIAEQVSPRSASSISDFHSRYLLPQNNEGEYYVGDLVWSKDRSLPWWPGQIFNPADASEKALKHHKKDCFLIAYFGIRTFAWNDKSRIRPFRTHFSQIEEQRSSEAYHQAINCALVEVYRRVQLGLACSCIPKNSFAEIESQIFENIGIHQEAERRICVDESTAASCFEPGELLEHIRSLALLPSAGCDGRLQLTISKAQVAAFSRFKGQHPLPEFHFCDGLLENDANTSRLSDVIQEHSEQVKGENNTSSKRKRDLADNLPPRKKGRSMSDLISDMPQSDGEEERDSDSRDSSVTSSAARKRKALKSLIDGSGKRQIYYAAKVSTTAPQTPKKSFKVGECILKVASQLTGSPSLVKCNSEKFVETDDSVDQHHGFEYFSQTSVNSQQGMMLSLKHSSIDEMLLQLRLAAQDPTKRYSFLNEITSFFSSFRQSVMEKNSRRWNQRIGRDSRKNKAPQSIINPPEGFEFDDVNDSYWADRKVQNYDEEQILDRGQNGEAENQLVPNEADREQILDTAQYGEAKSQLVPSEADKPVKSGRRSRKRFSSGKQVMVAAEPVVEHMDFRRPDCSPTELILKFTEGKYIPSELNLNKIFRRFGPLKEPETEIDRESSSAKVVYKRCSDAKVALSSAGIFNIFGPMLVSYELGYIRSAPYKTLPAATVQDQEDAS